MPGRATTTWCCPASATRAIASSRGAPLIPPCSPSRPTSVPTFRRSSRTFPGSARRPGRSALAADAGEPGDARARNSRAGAPPRHRRAHPIDRGGRRRLRSRSAESDDRTRATVTVTGSVAPNKAPLFFEGSAKARPSRRTRPGRRAEARSRRASTSFDCADVPALFERMFALRKELTGPTALVHDRPFSALFAAHEARVNGRWVDKPGYPRGRRSLDGVHDLADRVGRRAGDDAAVDRRRQQDVARARVRDHRVCARRWPGAVGLLPRHLRRQDLVRRRFRAAACRRRRCRRARRARSPSSTNTPAAGISSGAAPRPSPCCSSSSRCWNATPSCAPARRASAGRRRPAARRTRWSSCGSATSSWASSSTSTAASWSSADRRQPGWRPPGWRWRRRSCKQPRYLVTAKAIGEHYYERFVRVGLTCGGPGDVLQAPDSQSAAALLDSFMTLFEATRDRVWIDRARATAHLLASWVISYDAPGAGRSCVDSRIRATGAVFWSAGSGRGSPGYVLSSGDALLRLYRATGDVALLELLRDTVHNLAQYLPEGERPKFPEMDDRAMRASRFGTLARASRQRCPGGRRVRRHRVAVVHGGAQHLRARRHRLRVRVRPPRRRVSRSGRAGGWCWRSRTRPRWTRRFASCRRRRTAPPSRCARVQCSTRRRRSCRRGRRSR